MFLILSMLRQLPTEVNSEANDDPDTAKSEQMITRLLNMMSIVVSMILGAVTLGIIIDSFGPNGSYISTFFEHDDVLIDVLGQLFVRILGLTALITCLMVCCFMSPAPVHSADE